MRLNMRRIVYVLSLVLAMLPPLQSLAAVSPMPCHEPSSHHDEGMHEHDQELAHRHETQAHHGCSACAACCAGAAISYSFQVVLDALPDEAAAPTPPASFSGPSPVRLDRPPQ